MTQDLARKLTHGGMSENQAQATQERANSLLDGKPNRSKMDKDSVLMTPVSEWESSDRRRPGVKVFSYPSDPFQAGYERIDWDD